MQALYTLFFLFFLFSGQLCQTYSKTRGIRSGSSSSGSWSSSKTRAIGSRSSSSSISVKPEGPPSGNLKSFGWTLVQEAVMALLQNINDDGGIPIGDKAIQIDLTP